MRDCSVCNSKPSYGSRFVLILIASTIALSSAQAAAPNQTSIIDLPPVEASFYAGGQVTRNLKITIAVALPNPCDVAAVSARRATLADRVIELVPAAATEADSDADLVENLRSALSEDLKAKIGCPNLRVLVTAYNIR